MQSENKRILVVDDSAVMRDAVGAALTGAGYEVVKAIDGADGLRRVRADERIALVICDVNMPRMNGLDMLDAIMREPRGAGLHVLMMTTEGQHSLIERARKAGARGWIVKPFHGPSLVLVVGKLLAPPT